MSKEFELNDVVWAKVNGYPWWPGFITSKVDDRKYQVIFFGDLTTAFLKPDKILCFEEEQPHIAKESKNLKQSIAQAQRVSTKEITL